MNNAYLYAIRDRVSISILTTHISIVLDMDPARPLWYPPDQWDHLPRDVQYQIAASAMPPRPPIHDFDRDGPCGDPFPQQNMGENNIDPNLQLALDANKKRKKKKKTKKRSPDTRDDSAEVDRQKKKKPALRRGIREGDEVNSYSQTQTQGQSTDTHGDVSHLPSESPPLEFPPSPTFSQPPIRSPTPRHWTPPLPEHAFSHSRQIDHAGSLNEPGQNPAEPFQNRPDNRPRTNALFDHIKSLKAQNAALESQCAAMHERQTELEAKINSVHTEVTQAQIHTFNNGPSKAPRTREIRSKQDRMRRREEPSDESDSDEDDGEQDIQGSFKYKTLLQSNLPPHLHAAKNFLQRFQRQAFWHLCGVNSSQNWPSIDEPREDDYYTPDFDEDVTHATNSAICKRVAESVYTELKGLRELPDELRHPDVYFSCRTIEEMAKATYCGFRDQAKAQRTDAKAQKRKHNKRNTRRYQRRFHTLNHLLSVVPEYIKQYGHDPTPILEVDVISDYASGPESDDDEPQHMWKARMGAKLGVDVRKVDKKMWADTICWEHIIPEWRSEEVGTILDRLQHLHVLSLDENARKRYQAYRVYRTGRSTTMPPTFIPWDFAISKKWWDDHHPSWKKQTCKWYSRGDPEGFGKHDPQAVAIAGPSSAHH
ncbi:hypothetical protein NEOLEDRAFT_1184603 [Neolentinus lepideus HHB14362 ss-1]|uniref:Uncharacterized protein n=1 Tax=Neolentinus lepideus HHB14362 ss-1 TaxID=1314782 RepID=A0A165MA36_9AGAM|nr:hypothetical protein NEOLEDRAFT_1184603 [Neolentinus lepideus HHB14362 ss-1]